MAKQLVIEGEFKRCGVEIEYILAEYPDTPEGQLSKNIKAVIAEYEREKINQRMTRGRRRVVKSGKVMLHGGNKAPYGYRLEDGMLVIYEPEAKIVRLIFTWYVYGDENGKKLSLKAIARRLTEMKVPTWADTRKKRFGKKRGPGVWCYSTVGDILASETYAGTWHYSKKGNAREHWLAVEVPAIVSRELWEAVQERRKHNKEMAKRNTKNEYLLSRRVTCQCGTKMTGRPSRGRSTILYYLCCARVGQIASHTCDMPYFRADQVDKAVWEKVKEWLQHTEVLRQTLEEAQAQREEANKPLRDRLAVVDDLLADNRRQLEKLLDLYLSGDFPKEVLTERKARLETTIAALEKERADLVVTLEAQTLTDEQILTIEQYAGEIADGLEEAENDFEARRRIIEGMDVQVRLTVEDGVKVAWASWLVSNEERLSIEDTTSCISPRWP